MILYTKINLRRVTDLNIRAKIMKLSENTGVNLHDLGLGNVFRKTTKMAGLQN